MSKLSYWEKRKAALMIGQMDKAEKQAEQIAKVYELAMRHLQGQADKVFDKFQRDYGLTEDQAKEVLSRAHKLDNINDLKRVLEASPNDPNVQQLLADLDSPAYAHRIEQFHRLQKQTKATVEKLAGAEIASSQGFYRRIAGDSFHRSTFALQQQTGLGYQFNSPSDAEIEALLRSNWEGSNFSKRIWNNMQSLAQSLKNEMLVGLMTGRSNKVMAEVIERKFLTGKANARRLVRTETAFFHGQMELKSYEEADVEWYRFVAVLDFRTSEKCQHQDGKTYKVSEAVEGVNYPPLHPYCRSTTIASDDKEWLSKLERRARDPETGKTVLVPADMKYKEWYEKFVEKVPETVEKVIDVPELPKGIFGERRKVLQDAEPYRSVKDEWLANADFSEAKVSDMTYWEHEGVKLPLKPKAVVLDYSQREKEVATWLSVVLGRNFQMVPKVSIPDGVKTPDYLVDGLRFDLKDVDGNSKDVLKRAIRKKKYQATNFIFDINDTKLTEEELVTRLKDLMSDNRYRWVESVLLTNYKDKQVVEILQRK